MKALTTETTLERLGSPKRVAYVTLGLATLIVLGSAPVVPPSADASPAARNGRLALSVLQDQVVTPPRTGPPVLDDRDIFTFSSTGGAVHQLTSGPDRDGQPGWSPDGKSIVFYRAHLTSGSISTDLYLVNEDGSGLRNLTNTPSINEYQPDFSHDGTRIVYASDAADPVANLVFRATELEPQIDLYVMKADTGEVVQITSEDGGEGYPAWSPTGEWIAFQSGGRISLVKPDGSQQHVIQKRVSGGAPQWSPDGSRIVFDTLGGDVWVMGSDGSDLRNLTAGTPWLNRYPTWSPDGRLIAFISDRDGRWKLYTMRPDGSRVRELLDIDLQAPHAGADWGPRP